eukprot:4424151-Pleurochrysis_carterae.AAC.1
MLRTGSARAPHMFRVQARFAERRRGGGRASIPHVRKLLVVRTCSARAPHMLRAGVRGCCSGSGGARRWAREPPRP